MRNISSIFSSSVGNILEWYDFGLFSIFSSLFSKLFFPSENPNVAMIATFGIFAVGFLCRPLGALIFGYIGDKSGRAKTLRLSILMITLPTLLISFLPTYGQIGIMAPILLMLTRMWQGISIGGEFSGNLIYLAESAPKPHRAFFTSLASAGANVGILLSALTAYLVTSFFTQEILENWGWRLPYLFSGMICLVVYRYRLKIKETYVFDYLKTKKRLVANPISTVFKKNMPHLLRTFGMVCMGSTFYFFCFVYLPVYLKESFGVSLNHLSMLISFFIFLMILFVPLSGWICDKIGRRKMLIFNSVFIFLSILPGFYLLRQNYFPIVLFVLLIFTLASSLEQGTTCIAVIENFPAPTRYTGVSLAYNIGNGLLGGTVPMVCKWLSSFLSLPLLPAYYISACTLITCLVVFFFVPESKNSSLL